MENIDLELHDITDLGSEISERLKVTVDTVVMNPPFGTKHNKGCHNCSIFIVGIFMCLTTQL
ncbi:hypothetical protein DPMN_058078 [Dreissena polymorpha]|uniref:Uncharacterized protein n=1 Tax=Dreissena polymorpha TaxID=45954 RepID=A0A9D4HD23_DREPO|nr:hypothetical protein DPMN_058078 [Dreissena polymorpha]